MSSDRKIQIVIENRLYDLTNFSQIHPGGQHILEQFNNCDATDYFYAVHSNDARKMMKNMPSTEISQEDQLPQSDYLKLSDQLEKEGLFKADYLIEVLQILHTVAVFFLGTYYSYSHPLLAALCIGFGTLIGGWVAHQCEHQRNNVLRDINTFYATIFTGFSPNWWSDKHNLHHLSTNEMQHDGDIQLSPYLYLWKPSKEDDAWNRSLQHIYFSVLYSILHLKWQINSLTWTIEKRKYKELFGIIIHWIWNFCLPLPVWLIGVLFSGTCTAWVVTSNHQAEFMFDGKKEFLNGEAPRSKYQIHDYAAHQIITTRNIDTGSWLLNYMCGGMQYQVEHHMFPRIPLYRLAYVKPIVEKYCIEHGLTYNQESLLGVMKRNYNCILSFAKVEV